jgi:tetratricopeptide (TPR) repeat protein
MTALVACLLALAAPATHAAQRQVSALPDARILVVPFETPARDGRAYWLGEAAAILVADDITARGLDGITRRARERAYDQLHLPANAVLSRATVIKVGELVGAGQIVVGDVRVDGDLLTIRAQRIRIDVGRADSEVSEHGNLRDVFAIAQSVARRVVPGGAEPSVPPRPSLQAFEQFVKGLLAEKPASQAEFLEQAIRLQPDYDRARIALWDVRTAEGDHAAALAAVRPVPPDGANGRRAKFLASVSLIALKQYDEAFSALRSLQQTSPDAAVLNNLAVIQIRRGATPETGKPTYYLTKAAEAAPDDPDILFNLGYAYALDRDPQGALYWLREALRRDPADGDAHIVLAAELDATGGTVEAARERELAAQLSARWSESARRSGGTRDPLPHGLERLRQDLETHTVEAIDKALTNTAQRDQQDLARFHLERGRRFFDAEEDREAMAELRRAVFLSPYEADAHLLIGRIYLRGGRPREAVTALKISIWSKNTASAHAALAEAYLALKDVPAARAEVQKALALDPASKEAKGLLEKIGR